MGMGKNRSRDDPHHVNAWLWEGRHPDLQEKMRDIFKKRPIQNQTAQVSLWDSWKKVKHNQPKTKRESMDFFMK